jgi:predicted nuclease of predicted toxin-antitoxin system
MKLTSRSVRMKRPKGMARLYANENFPLPTVEELRRLGHDTLTSREAGKSGQAIPDEDVLRFAVSENRVLLTLNRKHFVHLHMASPDHAGIVVCTFDVDFSALAHRVHAAINSLSNLSGQLIRINRPPT